MSAALSCTNPSQVSKVNATEHLFFFYVRLDRNSCSDILIASCDVYLLRFLY